MVGCINDNQKLFKNRNTNRQQEFIKKQNLLFYNFKQNRKNVILCCHMFTVEKGQSNELIMLVNVNSNIKQHNV